MQSVGHTVGFPNLLIKDYGHELQTREIMSIQWGAEN